MATYTRPYNVVISSKISCLNAYKTKKEKWQVIESFSEKTCDDIFREDPTMENPEACVASLNSWKKEEKEKALNVLKCNYTEMIVNECEAHHTSHCPFMVFCTEILQALPTHLPQSNSFDSSRYVLWTILTVLIKGKDPHYLSDEIGDDEEEMNDVRVDDQKDELTEERCEFTKSDTELLMDEKIGDECSFQFEEVASEIWEFSPKTKPAQLLKTIFYFNCGVNHKKNIQYTRDTALLAFRSSVMTYNTIASRSPRQCNIYKTLKSIEKEGKVYKVSLIIHYVLFKIIIYNSPYTVMMIIVKYYTDIFITIIRKSIICFRETRQFSLPFLRKQSWGCGLLSRR
tara:strand:+ start:917 stop:1945 length:1029 start_codon:yes stop_codon:yes gene_type:complete